MESFRFRRRSMFHLYGLGMIFFWETMGPTSSLSTLTIKDGHGLNDSHNLATLACKRLNRKALVVLGS